MSPNSGVWNRFYTKNSALFLSSGNKICASGNRVHALNWFYSANSRTELGMVRELKSRQSDGAAK
ncbi:hypothetical protein MRBBS_1908 [Marinobacter sp. BSs20148]|nr:hypothetical protein MRBBS_1908 [Marinobacter sp. BSs20148]